MNPSTGPVNDGQMAITQQLARISAAELDACRHSVAVLHQLCTYGLVGGQDYQDLGWAAGLLRMLGHSAIAGHPEFAVLAEALQGQEVNPAYQNEPHSAWVHPVTAHPPDVVGAIAKQLEHIAADQLAAAALTLPPARTRGVADVALVLTSAFVQLQDFYTGAAGRALAVVLWWD